MSNWLDKSAGIVVGLFFLAIAGFLIYTMVVNDSSIGDIIGISFWVLIFSFMGIIAITLAIVA